MKKLFLLLLTGFSLVAAKAQVQFGLKAGGNLSTVTGDNVDEAKSKIGFHAGALVAIPLFSDFSLQPEAVYSSQGFKMKEEGVTVTMNSNYVNVPVLFKYNNQSGFFAETGPQIGFLLSAKEKFQGHSMDMKSYFNSTDFSWALGVGYLLKELNAGIDVRYNLGISNLAKDNDEGKIKNSVFQVGVFYLFGEKGGNK